MSRRRVVVTGAGSYVGQAVVQDLASREDLTVTALGSPRWDAQAPDGVTAWACDLSQAIDAQVAEALDSAESIVHLAWVRGAKRSIVHAQNNAILDRLAGGAGLSRVTFTSTVAAGPDAPSVYGRIKQGVADRVADSGGRVLVLGGVVEDPPGSSHAELCRTVESSRVALRFVPPVPVLHLTTLGAVVTAVRDAVLGALGPGVHPVFDPDPISINAFMKRLEARAPRARMPMPLSAPGLLALRRPLGPTPVGPILDRLASFVGRDARWLAGLQSATSEHEAPADPGEA
ncbi:MAG: hypothetical protein QF464_08680 [Myxococcota bacterium]|nr:hypothetical protein [Myxococcota bacterium]